MKKYYANGLEFEIEKEADGWYSAYRIHDVSRTRIPEIQAKDIDHAKSYCNMLEAVPCPMARLC